MSFETSSSECLRRFRPHTERGMFRAKILRQPTLSIALIIGPLLLVSGIFVCKLTANESEPDKIVIAGGGIMIASAVIFFILGVVNFFENDSRSAMCEKFSGPEIHNILAKCCLAEGNNTRFEPDTLNKYAKAAFEAKRTGNTDPKATTEHKDGLKVGHFSSMPRDGNVTPFPLPETLPGNIPTRRPSMPADHLNPSSFDDNIKALSSKDSDVVMKAIQNLEKLRNKRARSYLIAVWGRGDLPHEVQMAARCLYSDFDGR